MKHGDKITTRVSWCRKGLGMRYLTYNFRCDPVPFTGLRFRKWFYAWHKKPRTTQERRMSFAHKEYTRGRRTGCNLPNTDDDVLRSDCRTRKSWKKRFKVKRQWMKHESLSM